MTPSVVDQIVGSLELLTTEVASVTKLGLVHQLMFLERVLQFERHPAVLAGEVPHVGVDLQVYVVGGDLVEGLAALLATPAVAADAVRPEVNVDAVTGLELLPALITTVWPVWKIVIRGDSPICLVSPFECLKRT